MMLKTLLLLVSITIFCSLPAFAQQKKNATPSQGQQMACVPLEAALEELGNAGFKPMYRGSVLGNDNKIKMVIFGDSKKNFMVLFLFEAEKVGLVGCKMTAGTDFEMLGIKT